MHEYALLNQRGQGRHSELTGVPRRHRFGGQDARPVRQDHRKTFQGAEFRADPQKGYGFGLELRVFDRFDEQR